MCRAICDVEAKSKSANFASWGLIFWGSHQKVWKRKPQKESELWKVGGPLRHNVLAAVASALELGFIDIVLNATNQQPRCRKQLPLDRQ